MGIFYATCSGTCTQVAFKQSVWQLIGLVVENRQGSATDVLLLFKRANVNTGMKTGIRKPIGDGFQGSCRY